MPSEEAYEAVLATLTEFGNQLRWHRDTINRAVGLLNDEVFGFRKIIDAIEAERKAQRENDEKERAAARLAVDTKLDALTSALRHVQRWQLVRVVIEAMILVAVLAFVFGRLL